MLTHLQKKEAVLSNPLQSKRAIQSPSSSYRAALVTNSRSHYFEEIAIIQSV